MLATIASTLALAASPYGADQGCDHIHRSAVAYNRITVLLKNHDAYPRMKRVRHYQTCVATKAKHRAAVRRSKRLREWRQSYTHKWPIRFNRLPAYDQAWAIRTGECESGNDPTTNTGNGYHGAHQWLLSTWHAAGGTGMPEDHSWHYQAVIAVHWMHVAGASQWPVCGV